MICNGKRNIVNCKIPGSGMRRCTALMMIVLCTALSTIAQKVTIDVADQPASVVFRSLIEQTGMNFVYSSDILDGVRVTLKASDRPLKKVLTCMFENTDIEFRIKGDNVILRRKRSRVDSHTMHAATPSHPRLSVPATDTNLLREVTVESNYGLPAVTTARIGSEKITSGDVARTPALLGEPDLVKTLVMQPGVAGGTEGLVGMYVHGGNADENQYILDNVPVYQVNHFAGLFSAFNSDIIRSADFYKSSMPAKFDGRLSSFVDVKLRDGDADAHHGSARLGLTSGEFDISGPIGSRTTYLVGLRRSWYDVITTPVLAIANVMQEDQTRWNYHFMDFNAKLRHRFSDRISGWTGVYYGADKLKTEVKDVGYDRDTTGNAVLDRNDVGWGNLVVYAGADYRLSEALRAGLTGAFTGNFSSVSMKSDYKTSNDCDHWKSSSSIRDLTLRGDVDWHLDSASHLRFGADYVHHTFRPQASEHFVRADGIESVRRIAPDSYGADEVNVYAEDELCLGERFMLAGGLHGSMFHISGKARWNMSPRLSLSYRPAAHIALKGGFSRTVQHVHQLTESDLSLPFDQWIPITGDLLPETADKVAAGAYWCSRDNVYAVSVEGYLKWMHNLVDYQDEYYLAPDPGLYAGCLTQGHGSSRGVDVKIEKLAGRLSGHIAYSLAWVDRTFPEKNGGVTYPARFDNRHTINVLVNWDINPKVRLNATWTGHSGNRFTFMPQLWTAPPEFNEGRNPFFIPDVPLRVPINNYQLPFYHRLDLSCMVSNRRGYWTFGLYNAYNNRNVVAIMRGYRSESYIDYENWTIVDIDHPVFQKVSLIPVIPSISYTWLF